MKDSTFQKIIQAENQEGEWYWLNNTECIFNEFLNKFNKFNNYMFEILNGEDETKKKALKYAISNEYDLWDYSNDIFSKVECEIETGESSIESLFYNAFQYIRKKNNLDNVDLYVIPQKEIKINKKTYRVDFEVINFITDKKIIVECDGYEYHSEKEQMKKDYERQRDLENVGYIVMRFLGTEIFNNPLKCVYEVYKRLDLIEIEKLEEK